MKKAAFFDIDGTILDRENYIPPGTVEGIRLMQQRGNYAFLCTGRTKAYVANRELLDIGFDGIISGCGTMIEFHDKVLYYKKLRRGQVRDAVAYFKEHHLAVIMEGRYHLFLDEEDFGDDPYIRKLNAEIGGNILPVTGTEADWEVSKFSCVAQQADVPKLREDLSGEYELHIHDIPVAEIVPKGCTKGTGIERVCGILGIPLSDSYAFGDSANDLPMFEVAGHSIAMGNGTETAKRCASYVTDSLRDDGIYNALRHFSLI